jgi:hypothetical protein
MKIITDTIEPLVETWDDPGDYPSGAGSGPLASFQYLAGLEGELVIELTGAERTEMLGWDTVSKWVAEVVDYRLPSGILSADWQCEVKGGERIWWTFWMCRQPAVATLWADEVESDPDYQVDEPDYDEDWDYDYD